MPWGVARWCPLVPLIPSCSSQGCAGGVLCRSLPPGCDLSPVWLWCQRDPSGHGPAAAVLSRTELLLGGRWGCSEQGERELCSRWTSPPGAGVCLSSWGVPDVLQVDLSSWGGYLNSCMLFGVVVHLWG